MYKFVFFILVFTSSLFANDNLANKKIKLLGEKKEEVSKRVSIKDIEKIGTQKFRVLNPYSKTYTNYSGVLLKDFIKNFAKQNVKSITFKAIDGYMITLDKKHWQKNTILLSTKTNGKYVGYENKGPIRIVYPKYNSSSENYAKNIPNWIWMINTIELR